MIVKTEITHQPEFYLAGITVRTTNQNEQSQKDIGDLWTRFMSGNLIQQISNRSGDDIFCVYTDYESDYTGYYTTLLGCMVDAIAGPDDGFTGLIVLADKYKIYTLAGKFPQNVHEAWQEIWDSGIDRKYTVDFDRYTANAKSFAETEVKIYVSIK